MSAAYIVLIDGATRSTPPDPMSHEFVLDAIDMPLKASIGAARVFTSRQTPTLRFPGGGLLIGDLYRRDGHPVFDGDMLSNIPAGAAALRRHIIEHCWGDYVLVLPGDDDSIAVGVTRSPSPACDLQCVHAVRDGRGFVTSDIGLAGRLGLHEQHVDFDAIAHRLTYPSLKTSRTALHGVAELLPGETMHVRARSTDLRQDWSPWHFVGPAARYRDMHEATDAIRSAIKGVVAAWADRDGALLLELSGGLDSSIIGTCLRNTRARVTCSTLTTSVPGADEREYASLVAHLLGVEPHATELQYEDALFEFPLPAQLLTPIIGPLQYVIDQTMQRCAERAGAESHYTGAGGDTVFCYLTNAAPAADAFRAAGLRTGLRAIQDISQFHQCTYWQAGRLAWRQLLAPPGPLHDVDRTLLSARAPFPEPGRHPWLDAPTDALSGDRQRVFGLTTTQFYRDGTTRGLGRRLRMPLLSQPVIEACLRAPSWMWFTGGQNRALARNAFADVLPPAILARRSKGSFTAYLGALLRRKKARMLEFLLDGELHARGFVDAQALRGIAHGTVTREPIIRILQLCATENWLRQRRTSP